MIDSIYRSQSGDPLPGQAALKPGIEGDKQRQNSTGSSGKHLKVFGTACRVTGNLPILHLGATIPTSLSGKSAGNKYPFWALLVYNYTFFRKILLNIVELAKKYSLCSRQIAQRPGAAECPAPNAITKKKAAQSLGCFCRLYFCFAAATLAKAAALAAMVSTISCSEWADDMNPASNWEGAR